MRQMTGGDAFFLYTDRKSKHQHLSMLYIYDQSTVRGGRLRFKTILEQLRSRLDSSPVYRQRLVQVPLNLDYPYWINDPDFDLEFHVRHIALPEPGDWRQLCIQLSRLHSRPLDMSRPVWEMYVIEGLDNVDFLPKGSFAIMTKVHHVAIDGMSAAEMTMGLHDLEPYPSSAARRESRWRPEPEPPPLELLARAGLNNFKHSFRVGRTLTGKLVASLQELTPGRPAQNREEDPSPLTRFNREISPNRVWDAARFALDDYKFIRRAVPGATINDVVLTVCGGAMMHYLDHHGETPDRSLAALVPISVRTESEKSSGGNKVHLTRAMLRTLERDPLQRLRLVYEEMQHVKELNAVSARDMTELQEELPAPTLLLAGAAVSASAGPGRTYRTKHNMIVTNVPGPQQPLYFCGAKLVMFTGLAVIVDNVGISHAVTSYDGGLVIAPLSDRAMMPDPEFYASCLYRAFEELKRAAEIAETRPAGRKKVAAVGRKQKARRTAK